MPALRSEYEESEDDDISKEEYSDHDLFEDEGDDPYADEYDDDEFEEDDGDHGISLKNKSQGISRSK